MKVLHVIGSMNIGGAETMIMNIYRNIDRNEYPFIFFVDLEEKSYYEDEINAMGGVIYRSGGGKSSHPIRYFVRLVSVIKENKINVIHVHTSNASAFYTLFIAKLCGVKKRIVHSHNTFGISSIKQKLFRRLLLSNATDLLSCGADASDWMYGNNACKAKIINLPVDCDKMKFNKILREENRNTWMSGKKTVFGHIGRMNEQKNPIYLINLFARVHAINKDTQLIYVGSGNLEPQIKTMISELKLENDIILIQSVPNASYVLNGMDAFLLPSKYEGFPTVALEAQANGLPIFISDRVTHAIKLTDLVHFISLDDDISTTAKNILEKCELRKEIAKQYARVIDENYGIKKVVNEVLGVYKNETAN